MVAAGLQLIEMLLGGEKMDVRQVSRAKAGPKVGRGVRCCTPGVGGLLIVIDGTGGGLCIVMGSGLVLLVLLANEKQFAKTLWVLGWFDGLS